MQRVETLRPDRGFVVGLLAVLVAALAVPLLLLLGARTYDLWGGVIVAPLLMILSVPAIRRQTEREGDPRLFPLLTGALILKLAGSVARYFVAFSVYGGVADATQYNAWGNKLFKLFWHGQFSTGLTSLSGTNFIRFLTGIVYSAVGPTKLGGFLAFSWLGFWGLFLYYRAFTIAVPEGRNRTYAWFVFFLPSLVFWPSSIGKEAWMTFALGVASFGVAKILAGKTFRGLVPVGIGLWFAAIVRPHVAGMLAVALVAGFLMKRPRPELRQLAPIAKAVALTGLVIVAAILVVRTDRYLHQKGVSISGDVAHSSVTSILTNVQERTDQGGSSFAPSILESPLRAPVAAVTVVFRPLLIDAHNTQSLIAAFEGTFLLLLSMVRYRWILSAFGSIRRQPYVAFAIGYAAIFVLGFSAVANFGLLARERVQLLPLYLVLLSIPPPELREPSPDPASAVEIP